MRTDRLNKSYVFIVFFITAVSLLSAACSTPPKTTDGSTTTDGKTTGDAGVTDTKKTDNTSVVDRTIPGTCSVDSDCTDASKPLCVQGVCKPECSLDVHCRDAKKSKCDNGRCVEPPPECQVDSDCNDASKPVCLSGVCTPSQPECTTDADCKDSAKPKCDAGTCVAASPVCRTDADCPVDAPVCQSGTCVKTQVECNADTDCKDPAKPKCDAGKCVANTVECVTSADCKDPTKPKCDAGKCVAESTPGCTDNNDCKAPTPVCLAGICVPGECNADTDCKDPSLPKCKDYKCAPECTVDTDCTTPSTPLCKNGVCAPECSSNADCAAAGKGVCTNGVCKPECAADSDCTDANKPLCVKGVCAPKAGCKSDTDCASNKATPYCDFSSGACRACLVDKHCASYQVCNTTTWACVLRPGACVADTDCKGTPKTPYCLANACVSCRSNSDCPRLNSCVGGACAYTGCRSDQDCAPEATNKYCELVSKKCVVCSKDSHCKATEVCDASTYTCKLKPSCTTNADCKDPSLPVCNTTSKSCVACLGASDCKKDPNSVVAAACVKNVCVGCQASRDCQLGYLCTNGSCTEGCADKRDCPATKPTCDTTLKKCVECVSDTDCSGSSVCNKSTNTCDYRCTQPNRYDSGCYRETSGQARYCDGTTRTCKACLPVPLSATSTYDQGCNSRTPRCHPTKYTCTECRLATDCKASPGAVSSTCDATTYTCSECKQHTDCRRGFICNKSNKCTNGCLSNSDCSTGMVCDTTNNRCVGCLTDANCKSTETCDKNAQICVPKASRAECYPCTTDTDCSTGLKCIKTYIGPTSNNVQVSVRLKPCQATSGCSTGYTCCSPSNSTCSSRTYPARGGYCWPGYRIGGSTSEGYARYQTCRALLTIGQSCTKTSTYGTTCGHGPIPLGTQSYSDSICQLHNNTCAIPCRSNAECTTGYKCSCPPNMTSRNGSCYNGNQYFGPGRCVK